MKAILFRSESLGAEFHVVDIPEEHRDDAFISRDEMLQALANVDDEVMAKYIEGGELSETDVRAALRRATIQLRAVPVLIGAAFKNKGVQPLLDAVVDYLPSPLDIPPVEGIDPNTGKPTSRPASDEAPFAALLFKTMTDPFARQLTSFRVCSGTVESGHTASNSSKGRRERIGRLLRMHANKREEQKDVHCGNIAAAVGLRTAATGDTLCDE